MKYLLNLLAIAYFASLVVLGQPVQSRDFREVVEESFRDKYKIEFLGVCPITEDWVAARVFREYGAMFIAGGGVKLPPRCIYDSDASLEALQRMLDPQTASVGGVLVTLQGSALNAFLDARKGAARIGLSINPRGGSVASARSFSKTVSLWNSRFVHGLNHWTNLGKIKPADAASARRATVREQVSLVLAWEEQKLWFSTDFSKSILYSVAAPGASQHNFLVALDVEQFANPRVRAILAEHGWFQTVKSDMPHFTFLGVEEKELPSLGLKPLIVGNQKFWIPNL